MEKDKKNLYYMDELSGYKISSDYSDVRGWKIIDPDNRTIGTIDNLLVNKEIQRVVYLDVIVDKDLIEDSRQHVHNAPINENGQEFMYKDGDNHIIVPIGSVVINKDTKTVMANNIRYDTFRNTSRYNRQQSFDRDYERRVMNSYYPDNTTATHSNDDTFYNRREFDNR
jgi:sporulation protein YlmC with PRC-barrel domain